MTKISDVEVVRLTAIANMLDDVQENAFDLDFWVDRLPEPAQTRLFGLIETKPACGFAGCAIGWAIHKKVIPGLALHRVSSTRWASMAFEPRYTVDGKTYHQFEAVAKALGISIKMAEHLFYSPTYKTRPTTEMVATRIRRLVAKVEAIRARDRKKAQKPLPESLRKLVEV